MSLADDTIDVLITMDAASDGGLGLAWWVRRVLSKGVKTDMYRPVPEVDVQDASQAAKDVPSRELPLGAGIVLDNDQSYPVCGWLTIRWAR